MDSGGVWGEKSEKERPSFIKLYLSRKGGKGIKVVD